MRSRRSTARSARSSDVVASRDQLRRALAVNALTKPLNVVVPAGVLAAAFLLGAWWLVVIALVCWALLVGATFFDEGEAARVGERVRTGLRADRTERDADPARFAEPIAARLRAAVAARASIREAAQDAASPLPDVTAEVDALLAAMQADAARAQRIHEFLAQESPAALERRLASEPSDAVRAALAAKRDAVVRLRQRLDQLYGELDHIVATLHTIQAEILAIDGIDDRALAGQVSELRTNVRLVAAGLEEAFAETRAREV